MSLWAASHWSSPPGGVGGRRCTNHYIMNTKHLKRPAHLASRSALFCSHCLCTGSGAAAPETTLHCSTSKSNLLSQWGSRLGQHAQRGTCEGTQTGPAEVPPHSCLLGLLPLALRVIARYFFCGFPKEDPEIWCSITEQAQWARGWPRKSPSTHLPDEGGKSDFCLLPCLHFLARDSDKDGCFPGTSTVQGVLCNMSLQV